MSTFESPGISSAPLRYRFAILVAGLAIFLYQALDRYVGASSDDVFITLWAGERLAAFDGLVNQNFEPVEVSSSLLHTVLVAGIATFAPTLTFLLNKALCLVTATAVLVLAWRNSGSLFRFGSTRTNFAALTTLVLMLAMYPAFLYWSLAGLETPIQTLVLFLFWVALSSHWNSRGSRRDTWLAVAAQIAYFLTRPEGFVLVLFSCIYVLLVFLFQREAVRRSLPLVVVPAIAFAILVGVRYALLGAFFPNPVYAKGSGFPFGDGWVYLSTYFRSSRLATVGLVAIVASALFLGFRLFKDRRGFDSNIPLVLLVGLISTQLSFVLVTGGDWMEAFRFVVPVIPLIALLTVWVVFGSVTGSIRFVEKRDWISNTQLSYLRTAGSTAAFLFLGVLAFINIYQGLRNTVSNHSNNSLQTSISEIFAEGYSLSGVNHAVMMLNAGHRRDLTATTPFIEQELPRLAREAKDGRIVCVSYQMGLVPYSMRRRAPDVDMYFVDTVGLCDRNIARLNLPRRQVGLALGLNILGTLKGQAGSLSEYVLAKNPNLVYYPRFVGGADAEYSRLGFVRAYTHPGGTFFFKSGA